MRALRLGRGRKKAVQEFGILKGVWMVAVLTAIMLAILLLFQIGLLRTDMD